MSKKMFDFCLGNPPYQAENGMPLYNYFIDAASAIAYSSMAVTPGRFLFNAGRTPKAWNGKILRDEHFKVLEFSSNSKDLFPDVDITGGVAITIRDEEKDYGAIGIFLPISEVGSIASKVLPAPSLQTIITEEYCFDLEAVYKDYPELKSQIKLNGKQSRLRTYIFELPEVFHDKKEADDDVRIFGAMQNRRICKFISRKYLLPQENLLKWKVFVPKANGCSALNETLSSPIIGRPIIGRPYDGNTETFIAIGSFDEENDSEACLKYVKSKFARLMLGTLKVTQHNAASTWANVPIQNFTVTGDIDWTQSVRAVDRQLYQKYGLNKNEIEFIEKSISELE